MKRSLYFAVILFALGAALSFAKAEPPITILWPSNEKPALKLTFGKFQQLYASGAEKTFVSDVIVQNMTAKAVPHVSFTVYLMDKSQVRIGEGTLQVSDINPGEQVKLPFQVQTIGLPATLTLSAKKDMLTKTVSLKVITVPPGAILKVDGQEAGLTPRLVNLTVGTHNLEFSKEGYANGTTPVEIAQDELSGGSISIELGGLSRDTVELRDGTVLLGDVVSMSMISVVVRVDGKDQTYQRNQIKKIMLVERQVTEQPAVIQPAPTQQK
jgi:PEGA domain